MLINYSVIFSVKLYTLNKDVKRVQTSPPVDQPGEVTRLQNKHKVLLSVYSLRIRLSGFLMKLNKLNMLTKSCHASPFQSVVH